MVKKKLVDNEELARGISNLSRKLVKLSTHLKKQDKDIAALKPLLKTASSAALLVKAAAWVFGAAISIASAYLLFHQVFTTIHP